jgi:hypothetical protein
MNQLYLHLAALENQLWELSEVKFWANFRRSKKQIPAGWPDLPTGLGCRIIIPAYPCDNLPNLFQQSGLLDDFAKTNLNQC